MTRTAVGQARSASPQVIEKLKSMGFNTYEAKVYLTLLKHHPATGYEISKESGVPQARAYDTLKALEASNVVVSVGGKPVTYIPVTPEELLDRWERDFKGSITFLRESLPRMGDETVEPVINLRGEESIFKHALEMINAAQRTVFRVAAAVAGTALSRIAETSPAPAPGSIGTARIQ